jgi:hypothetical protein
MVEVESVDVVEPSWVNAAQACEAGYMSVGELLADLRGDPALPVTASACGESMGQTQGMSWPASPA